MCLSFQGEWSFCIPFQLQFCSVQEFLSPSVYVHKTGNFCTASQEGSNCLIVAFTVDDKSWGVLLILRYYPFECVWVHTFTFVTTPVGIAVLCSEDVQFISQSASDVLRAFSVPPGKYHYVTSVKPCSLFQVRFNSYISRAIDTT